MGSNGLSIFRLSDKPYSPWKIIPLLILFRVCNAMLVRTYFNPDEYWQSVEVAYGLAFGKDLGFYSWEWQDQHALRSILHPGIFAGLYKFLRWLDIDQNPIIFRSAPWIFQGILAGIGDWFLYILGARLFGIRAGKLAMISYMINWFTLFCITRTFSNCMETIIITICLAVWPWEEDTNRLKQPIPLYDGLIRATFLGGLAVAIRPTAALLILPLALCAVVRALRCPRPMKATLLIFFKVMPGILVTLVLVLIPDYLFYGNKWVLPFINFMKFNAVSGASALYGTNSPLYFFTEAPLAMMSLFFPFFILGIWRNIFPSKRRLSEEEDSVLGAKLLILLWMVPNVVSSLSPHKEYRFVLPTLPIAFALIGDALRSKLFRHRDNPIIVMPIPSLPQLEDRETNEKGSCIVNGKKYKPLTEEDLKAAIMTSPETKNLDSDEDFSSVELDEDEEDEDDNISSLRNQDEEEKINPRDQLLIHSASSRKNRKTKSKKNKDIEFLNPTKSNVVLDSGNTIESNENNRSNKSPSKRKNEKSIKNKESTDLRSDIRIEEYSGSDDVENLFIDEMSSNNKSEIKQLPETSQQSRSNSPAPVSRPSRLFGIRRRGSVDDGETSFPFDLPSEVIKATNDIEDEEEREEDANQAVHEAGGVVNDFKSPILVVTSLFKRLQSWITGRNNSKKLHYKYAKFSENDDEGITNTTPSRRRKSSSTKDEHPVEPSSPSKTRSNPPVAIRGMNSAPVLTLIVIILNILISIYFLFIHQSGSVAIAQELGEMMLADAKDRTSGFDWTHETALVPAGGTKPPRQVGVKRPFTALLLTECHSTPFRSQMHVPPKDFKKWKRNALSNPIPTLSILDCAPRNVSTIPTRIIELNPSLKNTKYTRDFTENWLYHQAPLHFLEWSFGVSGVYRGNRDFDAIEEKLGCLTRKSVGHCLERPGCSWHDARLDDNVDANYSHKIRVHHNVKGTNTAVGCFPLAAAPQCNPYNDFCGVTWRFVGDGQDVHDAIEAGAWEGHHTVFERTIIYSRTGAPLKPGQIRSSGLGAVWVSPQSANVVRTVYGQDPGHMKTLTETNQLHESSSPLEISVRREDIFWQIDRMGFHRITARIESLKGKSDDLREVVPTPFYVVINARQGGEILPFLLRHGFEFRSHRFHAHRPEGDFDSAFEIWARKSETSVRPNSFRGFYDPERVELS